MAQKRKPDQTKLIAEAALALAAKSGWEAVTFKDIAKKAKVSAAAVEGAFSDVWDILQWVLKKLEKDTQAAVEDYLGDDWRDNLAEILMMRFELAQAHRDAYTSIAPAALRNPQLVRRFAKGFYRTLERMLELAGLQKSKCQPLSVTAFGAVYISLADTWSKDTTRDLSKTMAAIDKRLDILEQVMEYLKPLQA